MIKAKKLFGLFRIGPESFSDEFLLDGHLYMNTLRFFREYEQQDKLRADISEGLHSSYPGHRSVITVEGKPLKNVINVRINHPDADKVKIFSLFGLTERNLNNKIPEDVLRFGDTVVVILDGDEFLRRIQAQCRDLSLPLKTDLVEYVDSNQQAGLMGPFRKYSNLSNQSEFRIAVQHDKEGPFSLRIGNICDIAVKYKSNSINDLLEIGN